MIRRLSARARLASFAALLCVVAVLGVALPLSLELNSQQAQSQRQAAVTLAHTVAQLHSGDEAPALVVDGLIGVGVLSDRRELISQRGLSESVVSAFARRCPPRLVRAVALSSAGEDGPVAACAPLAGGKALLVVTAREGSSARLRQRRLLVMVIAFGCMAAGLSADVVRRALSPLKGVTDAARRLTQGELDVRVAAPGDAEFLPLADAINQLAATLATRQDEISARLELTRQLAAIVAHEVRNPLQSLTMLADVIAHEPELVERLKLLDMTLREVTLIEVVVQRLVGSGGELRLVRGQASLSELVERCAAMLGPRARDGAVNLTLRLPPERLMASVDAALLRRAVENLLLNAIQILSDAGGGEVLVTLTRAEAPARAIFTVDDSGPGVPVDDRARIFQLGVTNRRGGTGLGLALTKQVIDAHNATLSVEDSPLGGARFILSLPLEVD
ncbi:HAMP domain-containing histidine kinase [Myxococcota bacterium]|nr:HAMP domain-containing histidine kinase [Myxococcota bacterium]